MTNDLDFYIFKAIEKDKKLTDLYLGYMPFQWLYTKAKYSATCTEAVDFTLFDKTICGLLDIESSLSLEEIGEILGFNVINNPSKKKYKDFAEYEILKEALQNLEEFEMISTGDSSFSSCKLTAIGKEYFKLGKKFKIHTNKIFGLYFDNTNNDHKKAKDNFEYLKSEYIQENSINSVINYEDEQVLKSFAENQIPEIYNVKKMNSFKDVVLIDKQYKSVTFYAVFLIDLNSGNYKIFGYDHNTKKINNYFSSYLIEKGKIANNLLYEVIKSYGYYQNDTDTIVDFSYEQELIKSQHEIEEFINKDNNVSEKLVHTISNLQYFEPNMFFDNLETIIQNSEKEVWLIFNEISNFLLEKLSKIIDSIKDKYMFIYLPVNNQFKNQIQSLKHKIDQTLNTYVIVADITEFNIITQCSNKISIYKKNKVPLKIEDKLIEYYFIKKYSNIKININEYLDNFRQDFADEYLIPVSNDIDRRFSEIVNEENLSNYSTEEIESIDYKLRPFYNLTDYDETLTEIKDNKITLLNAVKNAREQKIKSFINLMFEELKGLSMTEERKFETLKFKIKNEKDKYKTSESNLFADLEKKILLKEREYELIRKRKSIVVDTNILIEEPKIVDIIGPLQNIIFSAKVIDELDRLKNNLTTKEKAQEAIREIRKHQKNKNITFDTSKVDNLPNDFNKKLPDNMILSVALQYKRKNPILLTNDKGLQIKAEMLEIPAKTITELTSLLSLSKRNKTNIRKKR